MGRETKCRNVQTNVFKSLVCYCKFFFFIWSLLSRLHRYTSLASLLSGRSRGAVKEQMGEGSCKVVLLLADVCFTDVFWGARTKERGRLSLDLQLRATCGVHSTFFIRGTMKTVLVAIYFYPMTTHSTWKKSHFHRSLQVTAIP